MRPIAIPSKMERVDAEPGPAPMLQWLAIDDLVIDDSYQRGLGGENWRAIARIAASFKWSRFSPVFVAPIEGGRYAVIDGQHRTHAAALCGFKAVPAQIVQMNAAEQAASFAAVNGLVTKVMPGQIFKAALVAGDEKARICNQAVLDAGCRLMLQNASTSDKQAGDIYALGLIKRLVGAGHAAIVSGALAALRNAECGAVPEFWNGQLLKLWLTVCVDRPGVVADVKRLAAFLDDFDLWECLDRAEDAAKKKRRLGFAGVTRFDLAAAELTERLDARFEAKGRAA